MIGVHTKWKLAQLPKKDCTENREREREREERKWLQYLDGGIMVGDP
jgi:hypothetical protein